MGFIDKVVATAKDVTGKASEKVHETFDKHGNKIEDGLDKAAEFVDEKTKGKYSDKITSATDKAKGAVEKLGSEDTEAAPETPPTEAPAPPSATGPDAPEEPPGPPTPTN